MMIKKIYSKLNPSVLLHIVHMDHLSSDSLSATKRNEISEPKNFLQAMFFEMPQNTEVKAHKHNPQERVTGQTHEACLIFKGSVELSVYDIDKSLVETLALKEGDCSILVNGGHSMKTLTSAQIFEFKNGPYNGSEMDRTYI